MLYEIIIIVFDQSCQTRLISLCLFLKIKMHVLTFRKVIVIFPTFRAELSKIPPQKPKKRSSQMSVISRSSDLTKFRLKKVEPEPLKPLRVQSVGPEAWCPPSLQDEAVAWGEIHSLEVKD